MKKIGKDQEKEWSKHIMVLRGHKDTIQNAIDALEQARDEYNGALQEARDFRDQVVADMEDYYDDRSEAWQEGDAGSAYVEWKDEWETIELEDFDPPIPELPEDDDNLENLPSEPQG